MSHDVPVTCRDIQSRREAQLNKPTEIFCASCFKPIHLPADPTPKRFRVCHPETGKELILWVHTLCRRPFANGAQAVMFPEAQ